MARRMYDVIILDTPPAFTEHVLAAFDARDVSILLATLDIPAAEEPAADARDARDARLRPRAAGAGAQPLGHQGRPDRRRGRRGRCGSPDLGADPHSRAVPASVNRGVPLVLDEPNHPVSQAREARPRAGPATGTRGRPVRPAQARGARGRRSPSASPERGMNLAERIEQARRSQEGPRDVEIGAPGSAHRIDPFASVKASVHQALLDSLGPKLYDPHLEQSELEQRVRETLQAVLEVEDTPLSAADRSRVAQEVSRRDPRPRSARVPAAGRRRHRDHGQRPTRSTSSGPAGSTPSTRRSPASLHLRRTIDKIVGRVGRRVDEASPMVDARLPDGIPRQRRRSPPLALDGSMLTIRKFSTDPFTADDLVAFGTITRDGRATSCEACVRGRLNIVVSGGTGIRQDDAAQRALAASSRTTSASSRSRTRPSCSCSRSTWCGSSRGRRTSRARARSRSATWSATRCACGPTASSSARSAAARRSTCCRR